MHYKSLGLLNRFSINPSTPSVARMVEYRSPRKQLHSMIGQVSITNEEARSASCAPSHAASWSSFWSSFPMAQDF